MTIKRQILIKRDGKSYPVTVEKNYPVYSEDNEKDFEELVELYKEYYDTEGLQPISS